MRAVIFNADDFGMSHSVNRGIVEAHQRGVVTSASLLVRHPAAEEAAQLAQANPSLGVGLHVDLRELIYVDGELVTLYSVVPVEDEAAVRAEVARQLARFQELMGRNPTHLDSHQHVHRLEPVRSIVLDTAQELGIPVRELDVPLVGDFYGQREKGAPAPEWITLEALIALLRSLPPGVTEIMCHPAHLDDLDSVYRDERAVELAVLCDPRLQQTLQEEGIERINFTTVPAQ